MRLNALHLIALTSNEYFAEVRCTYTNRQTLSVIARSSLYASEHRIVFPLRLYP
jgi:hypothetical protein